MAPLAKSASYNLFAVNPGQTRTLTLTIGPSGKAGTVVQGILYVDDFVDSLQFLSGSQLVAIPYEYTIGLDGRLEARVGSGGGVLRAVTPTRWCAAGW